MVDTIVPPFACKIIVIKGSTVNDSREEYNNVNYWRISMDFNTDDL